MVNSGVELKLNSINVDKASPQKVDEKIKLKAEGEGYGKLQYRFVAQAGEYKEVIQDFNENNEVTWTPSKPGKYNIYFVIKDETGRTIQKRITGYVLE